MAHDYTKDFFKVWAADNLIYGPIDLSTLQQWVQESRVFGTTWVHSQMDDAWRQAREIPPLLEPLRGAHGSATETRAVGNPIEPDELRPFSVFAGLSHELLEQFIHFSELCQAEADHIILKKGDPGDAVYFILAGEVRARLMIGREDKTLNRIPAGQFFGEMSMFTQAPRSADVVAIHSTRLMRVSSQAFLLLIKEVPALAAPFLFSMAAVMAHRIAETNQNLQKQVASEFVWR
jgi:hypothetical protein